MTKAFLAALALSIGLVGCGGSVKRPDGEQVTAATGISKFSGVTVSLSDQARKELVDNIKFDTELFASKVRSRLDVAKVIESSAVHTIRVTVTGVRVRGTFSAVMFGALAGADTVDGEVAILDKDKKVVRTFKVSAAYAFGGLGGGIDSVRLGYLYDKFAELTATELAPPAAK